MRFLSPFFASLSERCLNLTNYHPDLVLALIGIFVLATSVAIWFFLPRRRWLIAVVAALVFLLTDSIVRLRGIDEVSQSRVGITPPPQRDDNSYSGYQFHQHNMVLPALGTDGQHWIMQTEAMLEGKTGLRVRYMDYDNAPTGRPVYWSGSLHWVVTILAWGDHILTGETMGRALEHTMAWANTSILALMIIILPAAIARRFGQVPTALTAWCLVCIYPYYEFSFAGYFDHHGLVSSADFVMVLCLVGSGAGWLRNEQTKLESLTAAEKKLWDWLPTRPQARRWFIASGIAGGTGLWISTATVVPVMMGIGVGAVLATGWLGRKNAKDSPWVVDPSLWRLWGIAGACACLFYNFLEYFPSNFSWRLEANHPFYALAWYGAGDILYRLSLMIKGTEQSQGTFWRKQWKWFIADLAGPAVLLIVALAYRVHETHWPQQFMPVLNWPITWPVMEFFFFGWPVLIGLYWAARYFQRIGQPTDPNEAYWLKQWVIQLYDLLMVLAIPLTIMVYWSKVFVITPDSFLIILHVDYILEFRSTIEQMMNLSPVDILYIVSILPLVSVPILLLIFQRALPRPFKALLIIALFAGLVDLYLASKQIRWLGVDCAVWVAGLAAVALVVMKSEADVRWRFTRKVVSASIVLLLTGVFLRLNPEFFVQVLNLWNIHSTVMPWIWSDPTAVAAAQAAAAAGQVVAPPEVHHSVTLVWLIAGSMFCLADTLAVFAAGPLTACRIGRMAFSIVLLLLLPGFMMFLGWDPLDKVHSPDLQIVLDGVVLLGGAIWLADMLGLISLDAVPGQAARRGLLPRSICSGYTSLYFLATLLLPFPLYSAYMWVVLHFAMMISPLDLSQVITRDVAQRLRIRMGNDPGVIVSGPTTTTWMMYYGGFKGLGTLYWENVEGLQHTIDIYSTDINKGTEFLDQDKVKALVEKYKVTDIVLFAWDPFFEQYAKLAHGLRKDDETPPNAFLYNTFKRLAIPTWLRPIPYHMPDDPRLKNQWVFILEYVPEDQDQWDALLHIAEWTLGNGRPDAALMYLLGAPASSSNPAFEGILQAKPNYLPALIQLGLIEASQNNQKDLETTVRKVEANLDQADKLALEDRVDLGLLLLQTSQTPPATQQLQAALAGADEKGLRHVSTERLFSFLRYAAGANLAAQYPNQFQLGMSLLGPTLRAQIIYRQAVNEIYANHYPEALRLLRQCQELNPNDYESQFTLAQTLATAPDPALRNDTEALSLTDDLVKKAGAFNYDMLDLLACVNAELGHYEDAIFYAQRSLQSAQNTKTNSDDEKTSMAHKIDIIQIHLNLFEKRQPFHQQ